MKTSVWIIDTLQADEIWENPDLPMCDQGLCGNCECCCQDGVERCEFDEDPYCGAEGEEGDYQGGFNYTDVKFVNSENLPEPKHKKLRSEYFKRRSKSNTSSAKTCLDDNGKTRKVGVIILPLLFFNDKQNHFRRGIIKIHRLGCSGHLVIMNAHAEKTVDLSKQNTQLQAV